MRQISGNEYINSDNEVYNLTKDGKCAQCGECCKDVLPLDFVEIARIEKYVKSHHIKEQDHHISRSTVDMVCPFLNLETKKCVIYAVRPKICQKFICSMSKKEVASLQEEREDAGVIISMRAQFFDDKDDIISSPFAVQRRSSALSAHFTRNTHRGAGK